MIINALMARKEQAEDDIEWAYEWADQTEYWKKTHTSRTQYEKQWENAKKVAEQAQEGRSSIFCLTAITSALQGNM